MQRVENTRAFRLCVFGTENGFELFGWLSFSLNFIFWKFNLPSVNKPIRIVHINELYSLKILYMYETLAVIKKMHISKKYLIFWLNIIYIIKIKYDILIYNIQNFKIFNVFFKWCRTSNFLRTQYVTISELHTSDVNFHRLKSLKKFLSTKIPQRLFVKAMTHDRGLGVWVLIKIRTTTGGWVSSTSREHLITACRRVSATSTNNLRETYLTKRTSLRV